MTESVKLEIPYQVSALERAAGMLAGMAADLQGGTTPTKPVDSRATEKQARHAENAGEGVQQFKEGAQADTPAPEPEPQADTPAPDPVPEKEPADVELDADGLPWSSEIHSRNKSQDKDGRWKKRRIPKDMTDDQWKAKIAEVEGQLRALMAIGTEDATPAPETDRQSPEDAFPSPQSEAPAPTPEPEPQADAPAPAPEPEPQAETPEPPQTAGDTPDGFQALMQRVTPAMRDGLVTTAEITAVCKSHGVASLPMLGANPKAIAVVWPEIKALIERG